MLGSGTTVLFSTNFLVYGGKVIVLELDVFDVFVVFV